VIVPTLVGSTPSLVVKEMANDDAALNARLPRAISSGFFIIVLGWW